MPILAYEPDLNPPDGVEIPSPADVVRDLWPYKRHEILDQLSDDLHDKLAGQTYISAIVERRLSGRSVDHLIDDLIFKVGNSDWAREQWLYCYGDGE